MRDCTDPTRSVDVAAVIALVSAALGAILGYGFSEVVADPAQAEARAEITAGLPEPGQTLSAVEAATVQRWRELALDAKARCDAEPVYGPRADMIKRSIRWSLPERVR